MSGIDIIVQNIILFEPTIQMIQVRIDRTTFFSKFAEMTPFPPVPRRKQGLPKGKGEETVFWASRSQ
jgi:hypothetical protein